MSRLDTAQQLTVLSALVEGNSIRSIERMTGIHRDTIMRLGVRVGQDCARFLDSTVRGLRPMRVQADEIWTYVGKKEGRIRATDNVEILGDQYVFVAMDADSKLVISHYIGKRDGESTHRFIADLSDRIESRIQMSTDGWAPYIRAMEEYFPGNADYAQVVKVYGSALPGAAGGRDWYRPVRVMGALPTVIDGRPDRRYISTGYIERQNLTIRVQSRRFTRLTNAFSKKLENLKAAVALHFAHYNFVRVHSSLRITPAMASGLTGHLWDMAELLESVREAEIAA